MNHDPETNDIVRGFFEAKVIQISINPLFKLTSGKLSPIYIDHRKIFSHPLLRQKVVQKWAEMLKLKYASMMSTDNLVFAGTATAGIAPAYALAEYFHAGFVYVRSKAKEHGLQSLIEGTLPLNANVFLIDDMVTTGGSILGACENLQLEGIKSLIATSISSHNLRKTNEAFIKKKIKFESLFITPELFDIAYAKGFINSNELNTIMQWLTELDE